MTAVFDSIIDSRVEGAAIRTLASGARVARIVWEDNTCSNWYELASGVETTLSRIARQATQFDHAASAIVEVRYKCSTSGYLEWLTSYVYECGSMVAVH